MPEPSRESSRWYHSVVFVLVMLFVVLGPFGLPLLWKSPRFPRWSKWLLTPLIIAMFVWLTAKCVEILRSTLANFGQLQQP